MATTENRDDLGLLLLPCSAFFLADVAAIVKQLLACWLERRGDQWNLVGVIYNLISEFLSWFTSSFSCWIKLC